MLCFLFITCLDFHQVVCISLFNILANSLLRLVGQRSETSLFLFVFCLVCSQCKLELADDKNPTLLTKTTEVLYEYKGWSIL